MKASKLNLERTYLEDTILLADLPSEHSTRTFTRSDFAIRLMRPGKVEW